MLVSLRETLFGGWLGGNPAGAAVVADAGHSRIVNNWLVVGVANVRDINVIYGGVVAESAVVPISAAITDTVVAKTIVDAAIEANTRPPVARMPTIATSSPSPVARSPQSAGERRKYLRSWNPEVALRPVRPVAGGPDITRGRDSRLRVHRQYRWRDCNRDEHG